MYTYKCKTEAMAIGDLLESLQHTGDGKLGTLSLPLVELSKPCLQMKLQMKSFGLAKLFKTASVCDVRKGREPRASLHEIGAALKLVQRTLSAAGTTLERWPQPVPRGTDTGEIAAAKDKNTFFWFRLVSSTDALSS